MPAALVLAGGRSSRMGRDKASLPWGEGTLLSATVDRAAMATGSGPIACVAAPDQSLPPMPGGVEVARDRSQGRGPLEALAAGLHALAGRAECALVVGCDTPLLAPAVGRLLLERLGDHDAAVAVAGGRRQPLLAAYRVNLAPTADEVLAGGRSSLHALLDRVRVTEVCEDDLRRVDPDLRSLINCNDDAAYQRALALHASGA
ncbi:MAG: molybdenum cofactor guanylyltransferase [Planctomycetota bacterium]